MAEKSNSLNKTNKKELDKFYKTKYETYKQLTINVICCMIIGSALFFLVDCFMSKQINFSTLIPRCIMLIVIVPYIKITKHHSYKTNILISYVIIYAIYALTLYAVMRLDATERIYISSAFLLLQIGYIGFAIAIPKTWAQAGHLGLLVEIIIAGFIITDMNISLVFIIQLMAFVSIEYILYVFEESFESTYYSGEDIEQKMVHDQLTKAFNRNKLQDLCIGSSDELEMKRASFIMIDIDFFKKINDTYGHETGDVVLQNLVEIIRNCIRKSDYIIRWGGEEFIIIVPDCGEKKAGEIAETIRQQVELSDTNMCHATVSLGVAVYDGANYHNTINEADKALYYAKEHGRNRVIMSSTLSDK